MVEYEQLELGYTQFPFVVVVSPRAKRMRIVLSEECMEVRVPKGTPQSQIDAFVKEKHAWICRARSSLKRQTALNVLPLRWSPGSSIVRWGEKVSLDFQSAETFNKREQRKISTRKVEVLDGCPITIVLPKGKPWHQCERQIEKKVIQLLRENLGVQIERLLEKHITSFSKPTRWKWVHGRSRWGYCTSDGVLGFHWKLIFCPKDVVEYVVVHEMAHLIECNHSARFWSLVKSVMPNYKDQERWLKQKGALLR